MILALLFRKGPKKSLLLASPAIPPRKGEEFVAARPPQALLVTVGTTLIYGKKIVAKKETVKNI